MKQKPSVLSRQAVEVNPNTISSQYIDVAKLIAQHEDFNAGALVVFNGTVRKLSLGKEVDYLFYEAAEPIAIKMMDEILAEANRKWDLLKAFAVHRTGAVKLGESAVLVITASVHRKEAYEANRFIIERIKHELPLWKCEYFADGTKKWGGNCSCQDITGDPNKHIYD